MQPVSTEALVKLLAPALGSEQSETLVERATTHLGLAGPALSYDDAVRILDVLSSSDGIVGVSARFAKVRLARRASSVPPAPAPDTGAPTTVEPLAKPDPWSLDAVAKMLAPALGDEVAQEAVRNAAARLSLEGEPTETQILALLDDLAVRRGVIGTVARFAKSRLILRPSA